MDPYLGDFYSHPPIEEEEETANLDLLDDFQLWDGALEHNGWMAYDTTKEYTDDGMINYYDDDDEPKDITDMIDDDDREDQERSANESADSEAADDVEVADGTEVADDVEVADGTEVADDSLRTTKVDAVDSDGILNDAYSLLRAGVEAEDWNVSSRYALKATPPEFKANGVADPSMEFLPHQLSAAGWLRQVNRALLAYEMGLGKSFILISLILYRLQKWPHQQVIVVLPLPLLKQWKGDLELRIAPQPRVCVYHQSYNPVLEEVNLASYQVILTTFEVVLKQWSEWVRTANSFNAKFSGSLAGQLPIRGYYPLMLTHYGLLIVDEIGRLGNPKAQTTKAVCALEADMRVGATGTPIQNDYDELHSMMKFLRVKPWAKPSTFSKYFITKPNNRSRANILAPERNHILALTIRAIALHLKTTDTFNGKPVVSFRPPVMQMQRHKITEKEAETQQLTRPLWDPKLQARRKSHGTGLGRDETLPAIQNARRALVHPECAKFEFGESRKKTIKKVGNDDDDDLENPDNHQILSSYEEQLRKELKKRTKGAWHSTRMDIIVRAIEQRLKDEPLHKILIFDEFLSTLDVVANALEELNIAHLRYDASIRPDVRAASLAAFQNPSDLNAMVMLCTIQCAGVGLNLATARTVVILAPGWNPALERQAICRANRIGQAGDVWVYTFRVLDSIERRVYMLRRRKENKFDNLFNPKKLNRKRLDDIKGWSIAHFREHLSNLREDDPANDDDDDDDDDDDAAA